MNGELRRAVTHASRWSSAETKLAFRVQIRDSLAVEMLCRGATPYDVAKVLGDTIDTVEKHYAPFVPELRERVRRIMESSSEAEKLGTIRARSETKTEQVQ